MAQELRKRKVWQLIPDGEGNMVRSGSYTTEEYLVDVEVVGADAIKINALSKVIVTVASGKKFYADPISRADIADAIAIGTRDSILTTMWKLPEAGWTEVTMAELKEAQLKGLEAKGGLIQ